MPPSLRTFPIPGRVVKGRYDPSPLHDSRSVVRSKGPVQAQWFSPSDPRVPLGAGSVVQPTGPPWSVASFPPPLVPMRRGADNYGPGAWRLGAVPGAACAPGPTPSCGGLEFPLRQVRERLKGLGPRGPVWTAPPAGTLPPSIPAVWTHFTVRCSGAI